MAHPPSDPDDLGLRIAAAQEHQAAKDRPKRKHSTMAGYSVGMKMAMELVSGVLVGVVFGLALDQVFGTAPWGLIILLLLGCAAGFRLMLRTANSQAKRSAESLNADDDDPSDASMGQKDA